ncbi:hypothetical protein Fcan01_24179 [Folsomia candida]|uniref:Secreted protein n=1 Tax=Folsomia candida TaxID=158441 RepID=A0A226D6K5_FOLCA|nr:hypothetical protein Fcan01_24179 [Folsomia candida]
MSLNLKQVTTILILLSTPIVFCVPITPDANVDIVRTESSIPKPPTNLEIFRPESELKLRTMPRTRSARQSNYPFMIYGGWKFIVKKRLCPTDALLPCCFCCAGHRLSQIQYPVLVFYPDFCSAPLQDRRDGGGTRDLRVTSAVQHNGKPRETYVCVAFIVCDHN